MILVAIDSFKGSMSSLEAGNAAKRGILRAFPNENVLVKALADGGEGTYETLLEALGGEKIEITVRDPLGRDVQASYGILNDGIAVMEMAQASGITLLKPDELAPLNTNTFGFGQMIRDAYKRGAREFIIGIGGSATSEMGIGMLEALGFRFIDEHGGLVKPFLGNLDQIEAIDDSEVDKDILNIKIQLACDVTNPLNGPSGAVAVFGPQKGVKTDEIEVFDLKLSSFAKKVNEYTKTDYREAAGAGAAGGLGFTLMSVFKNLTVKSGADLIIEKLKIEDEIRKADILITGEGRIDNQTASGKGPGKIAILGKKYGCRVLGFSGILNIPYEKCYDIMDEIIQIKPDSMDMEMAMKKENAISNMENAVADFFQRI